MRDRFAEYYRPSPDEVKAYVTGATVVPDANVLLGLYELDRDQREQVLAVLAAVGERLWIPHQVGLEFQRNRMNVIRKRASAFERLARVHAARDLAAMQEALRELSLPSEISERVAHLLGPLAEALDAAKADFEAAVESLAAEHVVTPQQGLDADPVRSRLDELLGSRVGTPPDAEVRAKRIAEGLKRIEKQTPPGFKDAGKVGDDRKTGDYQLWAGLLEYAENAGPGARPILFVTADTKDDWFERSGGHPIGPLPALVAEFRDHSDAGYHQVTLNEFLRLANEHLNTVVQDSTILKVSTVGRSKFESRLRELGGEVGSLSLTPQMRALLVKAVAPPLSPSLERAMENVVASANRADIAWALDAALNAKSSSSNELALDEATRQARLESLRILLEGAGHAHRMSLDDAPNGPDEDLDEDDGQRV